MLSLLALGALGTGVAYVLTVFAAGRVGATKASATAFLIPPVALLLGGEGPGLPGVRQRRAPSARRTRG